MAPLFTGQNTRCDGNPMDLITQDFLGGSLGFESIDLAHDSPVPPGWERCLNLETGKLYFRQVAPPVDEPSLDFTLGPAIAAKTPSNGIVIHENDNYKGVTTFDDVRSALNKVPASSNLTPRKRSSLAGLGSTSSAAESISYPFGDEYVDGACHSCSLYAMVLKKDPKCPNCGKAVLMVKKPRVDFNAST